MGKRAHGKGGGLYRVSQEERAKLREGVPYVKLQTKDGSNVAWTDIAEEKGK